MKSEGSYLQQKIIIGEPLARVQEKSQKSIYHRSICAIRCLNQYKQPIGGSGILISKNLVLSCAHNFYEKMKGKKNHGIKVYFGDNGIADLKESYEVEDIRYMKEYEECDGQNKSAFDVALLKLKKQVSFQQFLQIALPCQTCLIDNNQQIQLKIFGFPCELSYNTSIENKLMLYQYGLALSNRIVKVASTEHKIYYGISSLKGQSGCPVVMSQQIIGIHLGADKITNEQSNIGRLIDLPLIAKLQNWCKQLNGYPFSICNQDKCFHCSLSVSVEEIGQDMIIFDQIKEQILTQNGKIEKKYIQKREIQKISRKLDYSNCKLKQINISQDIGLAQLNLGGNKLCAIDVSKNISLTHLNLKDNQISAIDLTKNKNLIYLGLENNKLTKISLFFSVQLIGHSLFNFSHQNSELCEIRIEYNSKDKINCINLKEEWEKKYQQKENVQHNKYGCKYVFIAVQLQ